MPLLRRKIRPQGFRGQGLIRGLGRAVFGLLGCVCDYLFAAVVGAVLPNGHDGGGSGPITVGLVAGPIHYDLVLPADAATWQAFGFASDVGVPLSHPDARGIVIDWGSEAFHTATGSYSDLRAGTVWTAATGDRAVLRVDVTTLAPDHAPKTLRLTEVEYQELRAAILQDLDSPVPLDAAGFGLTDRFFAAKGRFHLLRTCNVWISAVMDRAGLSFGRWTPTPYAVTLALWWHQAPT